MKLIKSISLLSLLTATSAMPSEKVSDQELAQAERKIIDSGVTNIQKLVEKVDEEGDADDRGIISTTLGLLFGTAPDPTPPPPQVIVVHTTSPAPYYPPYPGPVYGGVYGGYGGYGPYGDYGQYGGEYGQHGGEYGQHGGEYGQHGGEYGQHGGEYGQHGDYGQYGGEYGQQDGYNGYDPNYDPYEQLY